MLHYRTFRNTDPPVLSELWRSRQGQHGLYQPVWPSLLEQLVFAKLYFDYEGLVLAFEGDRPVGFAHAGFGPNEAEDCVSTELGTTCLVLVRRDCDEPRVAAGLVEQCEQYLRRRGAKVLYGGAIHPLNPFYLGLYGGSELPGVLKSDAPANEAFRSRGYKEIDQVMVLRRELAGFQPPMDRRQMQARRQMIVEETADPPPRSWWEACVLGEFHLTRFELVPRSGGQPVARATFRSIEAAGTTGVSRAAGLIELEVDESLRRRGLAVFLVSEAFRQLMRQGVSLVEAQCMSHNEAARGLYERLGLQHADTGTVYRKETFNARRA